MPYFLESGKLRFSSEETKIYRPAADRLRETYTTAVDLAGPISLDEWLLLAIADAALDGNLQILDYVIAKVEAEIMLRKLAS